jgi:hypothetical protein
MMPRIELEMFWANAGEMAPSTNAALKSANMRILMERHPSPSGPDYIRIMRRLEALSRFSHWI